MRVLARSLAPSLLGAALLAVVAACLRVDRFGDDCRAWPALPRGLLLAVTWMAAMALLTIGWRRIVCESLSLRHVFLCAALVHALALVSPPFLSLDPIYYAAIGRVVSRGGDAHQPLPAELPADDELLARLPPALRIPSTYGDGFNRLAAGLARLAPELPSALRAHQIAATAALFAAAALVAAAVAREQRARAAAEILFCPVVLVEAAGNGHNDAWLALTIAAAVLLLRRRLRGPALVVLALGVMIKASALLAVALVAGAIVLERWPAARHDRRLRWAAALAAVLGVAALALWRARLGQTSELARLIGDTTTALDHCTRSIECLPRSLLRVGLGWPDAAFAVGLSFRVAAALMLFEVARRHEPLEALTLGLFFYYLYLHPYMQSWYLLSLVPLLPVAAPRMRQPLQVFLVAGVFYYAVRIPFACATSPTVVAVKELAEGLIVIVPPTRMLLRQRRRASSGSWQATSPIAADDQASDVAC